MFLDDRIYPHITDYVVTDQFMSSDHCLCPWVQFMFQKCSLNPHSTVYVPIVQFMSPYYSLCP